MSNPDVIEVHTPGGVVTWEGVLGWRFNDPEGWLQIVEESEVTFLSLSGVDAVVVPNLAPSGEADVE